MQLFHIVWKTHIRNIYLTMAVQNPNNWHWVDKNCIEWAKKYFNDKLIGVSTSEDKDATKYSKINSISSFEGDCEVNQRKGKVISLFDLRTVLLISGHVEDEKFEGSISIPEIAFDSEIDEYQFEISIYKETSKLTEIKPVIRESLLPKLREIFQTFGKDLLFANGNDIQVSEDKVTSNFTKSNQQTSFTDLAASSTVPSSGTSKPSNNTSAKKVASSITGSSIKIGTGNLTSIHLEPTFNAPATDLYTTFLDKARIMAWSRSPIRCKGTEETIQLNEKFGLFGDNIESKLIEMVPNKLLVFEWRLNSWNTKITSTLKMEFHESKEYHETKLQVTWSGIPVGEEDRARGNFEDYYVRSIKITFGFGAVL